MNLSNFRLFRLALFACVTSGAAALTAGCGTEEVDPATDASDDSGATADTGASDDTGATIDTGAPVCGANPAGCLQDGCEPGFSCRPTGAEGCQPSHCSCDPADGTMTCTADCGPVSICQPDEEPACPAVLNPGAACSDEGLRCEEGTECCCGSCAPSLVCDCSSGTWACYATDFCMRPSCEGNTCATDADCVGGMGAGGEACIDGICRSASSCGDLGSMDTCDANPLCRWLVPGCADESQPTVAEGCYPRLNCDTAGAPCPFPLVCNPGVSVMPECAITTDPTEPICDACSETMGVCELGE